MMRIDGKALAETLRQTLAVRSQGFTVRAGRPAGLAVVLVGDDPASQVYTRNKEKAAQAASMHSVLHRLPVDATQVDVLTLVGALAADSAIDGILVQLPLPQHLDERAILDAVPPEKDVDGFHPINIGKLSLGLPSLVPCTPQGCVHLLRSVGCDIAGKHAVVIGRSNIVGKPMAQLLLAAHATVTIAHSRTANLPDIVRTADIVVAAVGRAEFVRGDWLKPGAVVLDVGINRVQTTDGKSRLVGDVHYDSAMQVASAITPVPGGVGPMTIACLLENTLIAAERRAGHA
jgi:methylenetetrahydrofolate dehydrogenase (NADP+) / methenyltetrahydrofolate cyclohydrolase